MSEGDPLRVIAKLDRDIREDVGKVNALVQIRHILAESSHKVGVVQRASSVLLQLFAFLDEEFPFLYARDTEGKTKAQKEVIEWLRVQIGKFEEQMLALLHSKSDTTQQAALDALLKLIYMKSERCLSEASKRLLKRLIAHLTCNLRSSQIRRTAAEDVFCIYDDVRLHSVVSMKEISGELDDLCSEALKLAALHYKENQAKEIKEAAYRNLLFFLQLVEIPESTERLVNFMDMSNVDSGDEADGPPRKRVKISDAAKKKNRNKQRSALDAAWRSFLALDFTASIPLFLEILMKLPLAVIPNMNNPLHLADFLTDSYSAGGELSIASLYGLYILMKSHGLEYPNFYPKLYAQLRPALFNSPRQETFLGLVKVFLSSKFLPEHLLAAFVKRLSRLALTAPPAAALFCVELVVKLVRRFEALLPLVDRPIDKLDESNNVDKIRRVDPYREFEDDPLQSNAWESSLWEIKTLQNHHWPDLAKTAKTINKRMTRELPQEVLTRSNRGIATALLTDSKKKPPPILVYNRRKALFEGDETILEVFDF